MSILWGDYRRLTTFQSSVLVVLREFPIKRMMKSRTVAIRAGLSIALSPGGQQRAITCATG